MSARLWAMTNPDGGNVREMNMPIFDLANAKAMIAERDAELALLRAEVKELEKDVKFALSRWDSRNVELERKDKLIARLVEAGREAIRFYRTVRDQRGGLVAQDGAELDNLLRLVAEAEREQKGGVA